MKKLNKMIAVMVLVCFGVSNVSLASEINSYKLSPPSSFSKLSGPEFKEAAQIQLGVRVALKELQGLDADSIRSLGIKPFAEKTVFSGKISGTIFFDEVQKININGQKVLTETENYLVRAATRNGSAYYCLISKSNDRGGYEISVVSERVLKVAMQKGDVKFTHESVDRNDKTAIDLYLEHEVTDENHTAIDGWIRERMERGDYAVDAPILGSPGSYGNAQKMVNGYLQYDKIIERIFSYLSRSGVNPKNIEKTKEALGDIDRRLVFIPYDDGDLPTTTIGGQKISVTAHSSAFATYIFLPRSVYLNILTKNIWSVGDCDLIEKQLVHEVGAMCGLKATVKNGKAWNLLDDAVEQLKEGKTVSPSRELQELAPLNLAELELRNDYAAGSVEKKSIFKKAMIGIIAATAGVVAILPFIGGNKKHQDKLSQSSSEQQPAGDPEIYNATAQPHQFARKYSVADILSDSKQAEAFIADYMGRESVFYKKIRINGIAMDGYNLNEDTLEPEQVRDWTAASKESLDLAVQIKILNGNKYGIRLTGQNDPDVARREAVGILKEKIESYESQYRSYPAFGGFLPWITMKDGFIHPTSDWADRLPALDNGEWAWSLYTAYHTLQKIGENDLAARYKKYFGILVKNAPSIFYDTGLRKIRAEVKIADPRATYVRGVNYSNNTAGYYLDDSFEGLMMVYFLTIFTDLPHAEKDHIWDGIKMEKITTSWGTTYKGWPEQSPVDGSPHTKWAFMFLPITDNPIAKKVYILQEKIRSNMHTCGIPVSANAPGRLGYIAYDPNVFGPYGSFSMIFGQTLQGDVTENNYGLAWLLNMLKADKMQGPAGSGESVSVKPGTNKLEEVSFVATVDGKMTIWLSMMGGILSETREALEKDGLYGKFIERVNAQYSKAFGDLSSVQDNARFRLPQKPIEGSYAPKVYAATSETLDLSTFWQYPVLDQWGDKTTVRVEGKKLIIELSNERSGGWGWSGGRLKEPLTPGKNSAIYLKGKGRFWLKLEAGNRKSFEVPVTLKGGDEWTKVPIDTAKGETFFAMAIDRIMDNVTISDRFYSPDGKLPDIKKIEAAKKAALAAQEIVVKKIVLDLRSIYRLSPEHCWGAAVVERSGDALVIRHNGAKDGSGWSWTGEELSKPYTLQVNEGIRLTGRGRFTLKLEGSKTVIRPIEMDTDRPIIISDLPAGLKIEKIVIDNVMPGAKVELKTIEIVSPAREDIKATENKKVTSWKVAGNGLLSRGLSLPLAAIGMPQLGSPAQNSTAVAESNEVAKVAIKVKGLIDKAYASRTSEVENAVLEEILKMDPKEALAGMRNLERGYLGWVTQRLSKLDRSKTPVLLDGIIDMLLKYFRSEGVTYSKWIGFRELKNFQDIPRVKEAITPVLEDEVLRGIYELGASPWGWDENCKYAAYRLGTLKDKRAVKPLIAQYSRGTDSTVADACFEALSEIDDPEGFEEIWKVKDYSWPGFSPEYYAELLSKFSHNDKAIQFIFEKGNIESNLRVYVRLNVEQKAVVLQRAKEQLGKNDLGYSSRILKIMVEKLGMTEYSDTYRIYKAFCLPRYDREYNSKEKSEILQIYAQGREILQTLDKAKFLELFEKFYINAQPPLFYSEVMDFDLVSSVIEERRMKEAIPLLESCLSGRAASKYGVRDRLAIFHLRVDLIMSEDINKDAICKKIEAGNIDELVKMGQKAIPELEHSLYIGYPPSYSITAAKALGRIGAPAKDALQLLKDLSNDNWPKDHLEAFREAIEQIEKATGIDGAPKQDAKDALKPEAKLRKLGGSNEDRASIATAIPRIGKMRYGENWRADRIAGILWDVNTGAISAQAAKEELTDLAPEVGKTIAEREAVYDGWLEKAALLVAALAIPRTAKYSKPSDGDIRLIVTRIKEAGVEVFIPKSRFPGDTVSKYRGIIEGIGGKLRVYQDVGDLQAMIKNPEKSMVMTSGTSDAETATLELLKQGAPNLRFMNFANMEDLDKMSEAELDNYEAEMFSILLIARIITPEDYLDKGNSTYRMLSHLLEDYMPEGISVENYIQDLVINAARLIKTILKALPVAAYQAMRESVEVLWSA